MVSHDYYMCQYNDVMICEQIFLRPYEKKEVLVNLKIHLVKNLARSHFFNISFNSAIFKRTAIPHKILWDLFIC